MGYGKIFETMFEGSLVGAGTAVFAVMSYVITKQRPDREVGSQVRLNPALMAAVFGCSEAEIEAAIDFLCRPDAHSSSKAEGGRRLVKLGEFEYRVVNGAKYRAIRSEEDRRESNRIYQKQHRSKAAGRAAGIDAGADVDARDDNREDVVQ